MSRLYGRVEDLNNVSKYFVDNYKKFYIPDYKAIEDEELINAPRVIFTYLTKDIVKYINDCDVKLRWDRNILGTEYSSEYEDENIIFFKTRQMIEEYKIDLIYYIGDLLRRKNYDYLQDNNDISCQYNDLLPLLVEYLFLKEEGKEEVFSDRNLSDLRMSAKDYCRTYDRCKKYPFIFKEETLLNKTFYYLIQFSSMDATLQIIDSIGNDKDELRLLIHDLVENKDHNREYILNERNINTYGFKRLRKEIDLRK